MSDDIKFAKIDELLRETGVGVNIRRELVPKLWNLLMESDAKQASKPKQYVTVWVDEDEETDHWNSYGSFDEAVKNAKNIVASDHDAAVRIAIVTHIVQASFEPKIEEV